MRVIDLSFPIKPAHWLFPIEMKKQTSHAEGDLFQASIITWANVHAYTHVDAPLHFTPGAPSISDIPLDTWWGEAAVVDISHVGAREPITAAVLEKAGAGIRQGDIVLIRTDWDQRTPFNSREYFTDSPFLTQDGAEWLLARGIRALAMDFVADAILRDVLNRPEEKRTREEFVSHQVLLHNRVQLIENLCNLNQLEHSRVLFFALPLNIEGSDGAPCRAVVLEL